MLRKLIPPTIKARLRPYYRKFFPLEPPSFKSENGHLPTILGLYIDLKCLAVCPHCCLLQENPEVFHGNRFMTEDLFHDILDNNTQAVDVIFTGGEALQHPKIFDWCKEVQERGMRAQIVSNGMSYTYDKIVDRLLHEKCFNNLQISLDGINEKDYVAAKGLKKANFQKICNNVTRVARAYKEDPDVTVVTSFIVSAENIHKTPSFIEHAIAMEVDMIHLHTLQLHDEANQKKLGNTLFSMPTEYQEIMKRRDYPLKIHIQPPIQSQYLHNYCGSLDNHLVTGPDGELTPCCHRPWNKSHGTFQTVLEPHNIPAAKEMRRGFMSGEPYEACKMCNRRLKGLFSFDPRVKKWEFLEITE